MYNLVLLPDVNYYFKNDFLKDWSPVQIEAQERILFLVLRDNKPREELQPEDFYPIGVSAGSIRSRKTAVSMFILWKG